VLSVPTVTADRLISGPFVRVWLGTFAAFASFGFVLLTLPLYVHDELDRGSVAIGLAVGSASITAVLGGPPAGRLADRRGRRPLILSGAAVMIACYLLLALGPSLPLVVLIRLVAGAGEAAFAIAILTAAADLAPAARRGEAMSLVTTASYLGLTIGPVAADFILGGDRFALNWIVAASLVVLGTVAVIQLGETRPVSAHEAPGGWLPPRTALLPGLLVLLALLGFGGFVAFSALYARELGFDRPGLIFALFGSVVVLVRTVGRKLPDRLGGRRTLVLCFVSLAVGLATIGAWQNETGLIVGTAIFAVGQALSYPAAVLLAMESSSEAERSAVVGGVTAFVDVALSLGAFTLGAVAAVTGYAGAFVVASVVALSGLLVVAPRRFARKVPVEEAVP
jgi:MFS family permease